ncbi:MAG TPA: sigma-70 family RNA polymerase sigma factor [Verrucomicrobiae bacterium]|nr:sigma-70 family RNA polymerase sigma factor [Verrucomicrobiae bacterium]
MPLWQKTKNNLSDFVRQRRYISKMTGDLNLLKQFTREQSQDAFAEIVRRHLNLVYSAALRQVRSPQLAEEIAQSVFSDLARNVGRLKPETNLTAWLYAVTRRTAIDVIRKESRRQLREQIAVEMQNMNATENSWTQIEPFLDEAMESLDETDRAAILLRYFENKNLREVGANLKISDDAAQKRVSRAIEKLREFLSKRNVTIGASGLTVLISANAVQSAPIGLAATISATAILTGTAISTSTAIATTKVIAMTTLQKSIISAAFVAAVGTGIFEVHQVSQLRDQNQNLQQQQASLAEQIQQLQRERDDATNQLAGLLAENAQLKSGSNEMELMKLRGEVSALRSRFEKSANKIEQPSLSSAQEYYERAQKHEMNHEYEAQLEDLNKAIELDPNMAEAYFERGNLYAENLPKEKGGYEKAVADYTSSLEIKPNDASARWNRATYYVNVGKYNEAIADWTTYIEGNTDFSNQLDGKTKSIAGAYFWRGHIYQMYLHDYSKAIADYTSAMQLNPNIEDAHRLRGQSYEALGEAEKAQQDFTIEPKRN